MRYTHQGISTSGAFINSVSVMHDFILKVVQEMELILRKEKGSLLLHFQCEWQIKWVPAILRFGETYSNKCLVLEDDYSKNQNER